MTYTIHYYSEALQAEIMSLLLHCLVKKSKKTPINERRIAEKRMKEVKQ